LDKKTLHQAFLHSNSQLIFADEISGLLANYDYKNADVTKPNSLMRSRTFNTLLEEPIDLIGGLLNSVVKSERVSKTNIVDYRMCQKKRNLNDFVRSL